MTRWDPFREVQDFREEMNRMVSRWFGDREQRQGGGRWTPAADVAETDQAYQIDLEVAGMRAEDLEVTVEHGMLCVQGERRAEEETDDRRVHRVERHYGAFRRAVSLPPNIDAERATASFQDGVLRVTVPKTEAVQPKRVTVQPQRSFLGPDDQRATRTPGCDGRASVSTSPPRRTRPACVRCLVPRPRRG